MLVSVSVSVFVLIGFYSPTQAAVFTKSTSTADLNQGSNKYKRQIGDDLCYIPEPLEHGQYFTHERRCPQGDNSAACRLVPSTPVNNGWVIRYSCDLGYQLNTSRITSICLRRAGGSLWRPALPSCLRSSYNSHFLPDQSICGKSASHLRTTREVDGKIAKRGAWPWMVIFGHSKTNDPRHGYHWFCAGTLLTDRHVLTAANCVASHRKRPIFVARFDDLNLDDSIKDGSNPIEVIIDKKNIIVHPGFHVNKVFEHNVAVVKLKSPITVTDFVRPICLPTPDFKDKGFANETVYFTSWSQTDDDHELNPKRKRRYEPILHEISGKVIDHDVCNQNYRHYQSRSTPIIISDQLICASVAIKQGCQGDIGSPLMLKYKDTFYLLGIVATEDNRCYDEFFPKLFTKVAVYMDWIVNNLGI